MSELIFRRPVLLYVLLAITAGLAAIAPDVPAASIIAIVPLAAIAMVLVVAHPGAWVGWFLAIALLMPPFAIYAGEVELPLHPAMLLLAAGAFVIWVRLPELCIARDAVAMTSTALLAATAISLPWAFYYSGTAVGGQSVLRWILLASGFLVFAWVAYGPASHRYLPRLILAASVVVAVFAIVDFLYQLPRTARFSDQYIYLNSGPLRRAQGVFYDASALGNFSVMILAFILALGRRARQALDIPTWLLWMPAPALAIAAVLSFSRGSVVNLLAAIVVLAFLRRRDLIGSRAIAAFVTLVAVIAVAATLVVPEFVEIYGARWEFSALEFFSRPNTVLSQRLDTWVELAVFIADHPLQVLIGIGYKSLPYTETFQHSLVADNMYLSLLIESGVLGLAALLAFCAALLAATWRLTRDANDAVSGLGRFLFAFGIGEMAQMLSGDILTYWRVTPVYLALLGLALRSRAVAANDASLHGSNE